MVNNRLGWSVAAVCLALAGAGCDDDEGAVADAGSEGSAADSGGLDAKDSGSGGSAADSGSSGSDDAGAKDAGTTSDNEKAQYLFSIAVAGDGNNGALYLLVQDEIDLDINLDDIAKANAVELEPYSGVAVIDGHVIIGKSDKPIAQKFTVAENGDFKQVGSDLHFDDYFQSTNDGLNFYFQAINGTDMFLHYGTDRAFRKHWNVRDWVLLEDFEETKLPTPPAGWTISSTGNRTGMRDWKGAVFQTFNMSEEATGASAEKSWITVYDPKTHKETSVHEVPCAGLQQQTADEDGNVYVSTTFSAPTLALYGEQAPSCIVRLEPDGSLDEEWGNKSLKDLTGGFDGVNFRYIGGGKAVANVLHHDRIENVDWDGDVDPAIVAKVEGEWVGDDYTPEDAKLWEIELIDLDAGTSTPITGWEKDHDVGSYLTGVTIDGRNFFDFQLDTYGPKPTEVMYELDVKTAKVKKVGVLEGTFAGLERLR